MTEKTLGEKRVRVDFNVTESSLIQEIKQKTAELINLMAFSEKTESTSPELARLMKLAQDHYEEAAMWAVKSVTK